MFIICLIFGFLCLPSCGYERIGILILAFIAAVSQVFQYFKIENKSYSCEMYFDFDSISVSVPDNKSFANWRSSCCEPCGECPQYCYIFVVSNCNFQWHSKYYQDIRSFANPYINYHHWSSKDHQRKTNQLQQLKTSWREHGTLRRDCEIILNLSSLSLNISEH